MTKESQKKFKISLSAFTIILILIFILAIVSHFLPAAQFVGDELVDGSGVIGASLADTLMSPILGFADAVDVGIFI